MTDQWFVLRGDQKSGPYSASQLQQLASSNQLLPADQVWKEGMDSWISASKLTGLFASPSSAPTPPPIKAADGPQGEQQSSPSPRASFLDRAKAGAAELAQTAKAAAQLTAKQAERTKLVQLTLPGAYAELGKQVHAAGDSRDTFQSLHENIDKILADTRNLETHGTDQPKPQGLADKAKAAAGAVKDAAQLKALQLKARSAYTELGKAIFEKDGDAASPAALANTIREHLNRLSELEAEIANLSSAPPGKRITPKRFAVIGGIMLLLVLGAIGKGLKKNTPTIESDPTAVGSKAEVDRSDQTPDEAISVAALLGMSHNAAKPKQVYGSRKFKVTGQVAEVRESTPPWVSLSEVWCISFKNDSPYGEVVCFLASGQDVASVVPGSYIVVRGKYYGATPAGKIHVEMSDCEILSK